MIMAKDSHGNYVKVEDIKQQDGFNGISPIEFKGSGENLENYRIYGNTVNGESVGNRTGNLFDGVLEKGGIDQQGKNVNTQGILKTRIRTKKFIEVIPNETYTIKIVASFDASVIMVFYSEESYQSDALGVTNWMYELSNTFNTPENCRYIRVLIRDRNNSQIDLTNISTIMLNSGSTALPYEPYGYRVPMTVANGTDTETTNLYLPEQIKMVGDEAEYIDYREQKQHRVRKNLLQNTATTQTINGVTFTVNDDGSVICNGTLLSNGASFFLSGTISFSKNVRLTGCPTGGGDNKFFLRFSRDDGTEQYIDSGSGITIPANVSGKINIRVFKNYTYDNLTFYPMIRLASIGDGTYEPYIEDTELDVTLPALPTLSGTNTLSVNTNIKPSKVWGGLNDPRDILYVKDKLGNILFSKYYEIEDEPPLTYKAKKAGTLKNYRIYGNTVNGESVGDLVENGEHTGEYRVPVTINSNTTSIYLPHQIRKVGDDAEYIDYGEQKQHRVRKNLLQNTATSQTINGVTFTVNSDGSVTCNGEATAAAVLEITNNWQTNIILGNRYIGSGCPSGGSDATYYLDLHNFGHDTGDSVITRASHTEGASYKLQIVIRTGYTCDNLTFYPMIRLASIEDDTYEPYIENTEVDVTLPTLPTLSGTNTLSVGTTVQPSDIYLKGKIEKKPKIYYYSQDGQTLLYTESVLKGSNGIYSGTPTKMADPQYTYTFAGWSSSTGQTTATSEVRNNIQNDKNVYAAFSQTLNTYTVYFYNESDTPIETV